MKKRINKKRVKAPAYAFGIDQMQGIAGIGGVAGSSMSAFGEEGSGADIAGGALSGAASGASIGMAAGPIGAIAGGVIGLAGGLFGGFNKRKKIREMKRRKETAQEAQLGLNNAAINESEYWDDNAMAYTYANGGIIPNDLAYLDNNEVIRDVYGNIDQVPNNKPGTDNHLVDASDLESVLSDKIKRPGTNKTFAEEGKKLTKMTKSSKGKDIFADNTNELNRRNANRKYNELLAEQEQVKAKKGIKPKNKGIPAYQNGGGDWTRRLGDYLVKKGKEFLLTPASNTNTNQSLGRAFTNTSNRAGLGASPNYVVKGSEGSDIQLNPNKRLIQTYGSAPAFYDYAPALPDYSVDGITGETILTPNISPVNTPEVEVNETNPSVSPVKAATPNKKSIQSGTKASTPNYLDSFNWAPTPPVQVFAGELPGLPTPTLTLNKPKLAEINVSDKETRDRESSKFNTGNLGDWLDLAPVAYNLIQGIRGPEIEDNVLNPYAGATARTMARRRMNINPAREANRRSRAIANYNAANMNANTGANLAFRTQAAVSEYANNADMYATKQNADNAYLGEYANMMNNLGQQFVQGQRLTDDANARNRAMSRTFTGTGLSQLGQWNQVRRQEKNQANRDEMIYPYLKNFLAYGNSKELIEDMDRRYYGRK